MQHGFISIINSFYDPQNLPLDTKIIVISLVEQEIYAIMKKCDLDLLFKAIHPFQYVIWKDLHLNIVSDMFLNSLVYDFFW